MLDEQQIDRLNLIHALERLLEYPTDDFLYWFVKLSDTRQDRVLDDEFTQDHVYKSRQRQLDDINIQRLLIPKKPEERHYEKRNREHYNKAIMLYICP